MSMDIFRKYDIRGIYNQDLTNEIAYEIGLSLGNIIFNNQNNTNKIAIGKDARLSGDALFENLSKGFMDAGIDVYYIGIAPTPVLYHYVATKDFQNGIIITGSHNPSEYNGMKIIINNTSFFGENIETLANIIKNKDFQKAEILGKLYDKSDAIENYENDVINRILTNNHKKNIFKNLKIVVDSGNGVAGIVAPELFRKLGCDVIDLYSDPDGNFPNHHPDPAKPENLKDLQQAVIDNNADLGIAFDGDADRLGVITNKAEIIYPDRYLMLFAIDVLQKHPKATIVYDVKCCKHLEEVIKQHNGTPLMYCTGHSLIKSKIKTSNAMLAGEMSGHIFFVDNWYGFDDGIYSGVRLLDIFAEVKNSENITFSELMNKYDDHSISTPEINIPAPDKEKHIIIENLAKSGQFGDCRKIEIDGLRVEYENGWGLVRASNTTPCLVLRFEGKDQNSINEIQNIFKRELAKVAPDLSY